MLLHIYTAIFNLYLNKYEVFYIIKLLSVYLNRRISEINALSANVTTNKSSDHLELISFNLPQRD